MRCSCLDLKGECVSEGADVVVVGEKDAVVADDHAVRVDVLLRPARRPTNRIMNVISLYSIILQEGNVLRKETKAPWWNRCLCLWLDFQKRRLVAN